MAYDTLGRVEKTVQGNVNYEIVTEYDEWSREKNKRYRPAGTANGDPLERTCATTYDTAGRLETMTDSNISPQPFTYANHSRTNLIDQLTHPNGLVQDKDWNSRSLLESIQTRNSVGSVLKSFTYGLNALAQRETIARETGTVLTFGYDQRRQVTSGEKTTDGTAFPIFDYGYQFDEIGNRESATDASSSSSTYTANALNQYSGITTNGTTANPTHDANGSLLNDGRIICTWDERNRMKSVEEVGSGKKSEMLYDAVGRRLERKDLDASDVIAKTTRYLYAGWNSVAEFESTGTATTFARTKTYTWGLDLSGTKEGAGGVGGLYATKNESTDEIYYYAPDGNGNIIALYTNDHTEAATYDYGPFGQVISQSGPYAEQNSYRFSTKPDNDWAGELNYYGYRFYESAKGRWLSRDLLGETGGINLLGFVFNSSPNHADYLGLKLSAECLVTLAELKRIATELAKEFAKYDPISDARGGHPIWSRGSINIGGMEVPRRVSKPGGHYREMRQFQRNLKRNITSFWENCVDDCDDDDPTLPALVVELAHRPISLPPGVEPIPNSAFEKAFEEYVHELARLRQLENQKAALIAAIGNLEGPVTIVSVSKAHETLTSQIIHGGAEVTMVVSATGVVILTGGRLSVPIRRITAAAGGGSLIPAFP